jgi:hypothetical protein
VFASDADGSGLFSKIKVDIFREGYKIRKKITILFDINFFFFLAGTRVLRVFASDADGSGPNAEVTYSIVSTHDKFSIDSKTGWLVTNAVSVFCLIGLIIMYLTNYCVIRKYV